MEDFVFSVKRGVTADCDDCQGCSRMWSKLGVDREICDLLAGWGRGWR